MLRRSYFTPLLISSSSPLMIVCATLVCAFFLLLRFDMAYAQSTPDSPDTPDTVAVVGSISGVVTDSAGVPLEDIRVVLYRYMIDEWVRDKSVSTDESGHYLFRYLETALYRIYFQSQTGTYAAHYYPNATVQDAAETIAVTGNDVVGIDTIMLRAGSMSGTITITGEVERTNVTVRIYRRYGSEWQQHYEIPLHDQAFRNDGDAAIATYSSGPILPGDYRICVDAEAFGDLTPWGYFREYIYSECYGDAIAPEPSTAITVAEGASTDGIDLNLGDRSVAPTIAGTVTNPDGEPLPNIPVYLFEKLEEGTGTAQELTRKMATDAMGQYAIHEIPTGLYRIGYNLYSSGTLTENVQYTGEYHENQPSRDQATLLDITAQTTGITVDAVLSRTGSISGVITIVGDVIPELVRVEAENRNSDATIGQAFSVENNTVVYQLDGLPAGSYRVSALARWEFVDIVKYYDDRLELADASSVQVTAGATTPNINFQLVKQDPMLGSIRGAVTSSAGPIETRMSVCVNGLQHSSTSCVDLAEDGSYQLFNLQPDTYTVCAGGRYFSNIYKETCYQDGSSTELVLEAGTNIAGIDIAIETTGSIQGDIYIEDGRRSIYRVEITLYRWDETTQAWQTASYLELSEAFFQDVDHYTVGRLDTGVHRMCIFAVSTDGERYDICYGGTDDVATATDITVTYGQVTSGIDFALEDRISGRIEGTVLADGAPQSGVQVELYTREQNVRTWWRMVYVETGIDGSYRINGLEAGEYRIRYVDPNDVYPAIFYGGGSSVETGESIMLQTGTVTSDVDVNLQILDKKIYLPVVNR